MYNCYRCICIVHSFNQVGLGPATDSQCKHHQHQAKEYGHRQLHGFPEHEVCQYFVSQMYSKICGLSQILT